MRAMLLLSLIAIQGASQDLLTPEMVWTLKRVSGGEISQDGRWALVSVRSTDMAANSSDADLWLYPLDGGAPKELTPGKGSESDFQWVATADGPRVWCLSGKTGSQQVHSIDPAAGTWSQVTDYAGGVANLKVGPGGRVIAFTMDVKIDQTIAERYPDLPKADARIIDGLLYRHWDAWHGVEFSHLHIARIDEGGKAGPATDLMAGLRTDSPLPPFGGSEQLAFSPDGKSIAWTMMLSQNPAESTDTNIYVRAVEGDERARCLSTGMEGYDQNPVWSPDGRKLLWHSMERAGFESDRTRLMVHDFDLDHVYEATRGMDANALDARWLPDSSTVLFRSEILGTEQIFRLTVREGDDEVAPQPITEGRFNWALAGMSADGGTLVLSRQDMLRPPELFVRRGNGAPRALTDVNGAIYAGLRLPAVEERLIRATDGQEIHAWVIKPPGFDRTKKYPMLTYCQGGPQSQIGQSFSFRWCFHAMAAHGYVVLAPNRRGLPGFGQDWNDEISGDWGGQAMRDILASTDDLLTEGWIDARRVAAVGASFGGYTVYWLMGNAKDRFAAMIAHCGVFNLESMYGATEELFFANWDLGGPYWKSDGARALYEQFSPHRFIGRWKTPLLVIHGEKDFRVPFNQGMEAFTAAQVSGVPSRFLCFPNAGHWISKPQDSLLWSRVFFEWLDEHTRAK